MIKKPLFHKIYESGQGLLEYILILGLLAVIGAIGVHLVGNTTSANLEMLSPAFNQSSSANPGEEDGTGTPEVEQTEASEEETITLEGDLLAFDDFDDLKNWKKIDGPNCWKTDEGVLQVTKGDCTSVLKNNTLLPNDYWVNLANAKLVSGDGYGLMFRLSDEKNGFTGYSFQVDQGLGDKFVFRRYDKYGTELSQPLAIVSAPAGFDFNAAHNVSVNVIGDTFTAYIDGVKVLTAQDDTYSSGSTGLRTWGASHSEFDSFSVNSQ